MEALSARSVLIDQAAQLLGVSRRTIYYRIREGRLRTIRTRCGSQRVLLESVEDLSRDGVRGTASGEGATIRLPDATGRAAVV